MLRNMRNVLGILLLALSIVILVWAYWPVQRETRIRPVSNPEELALPEERVLTLVFPPKIRVGEPSVIRLSLAARDQGSMGGESDAAVSTFYETHQVIAEARFDLPGMRIRPSELISAPISHGQIAVFYWTLLSSEVGQNRGTIWLYLRTVDKSTGQENREAVSAQIVEIESVKLLGLASNQARIVGLVGGAIGIALVMSLFGALISKLTRKRSEIL
jgi:hypothetical protein